MCRKDENARRACPVVRCEGRIPHLCIHIDISPFLVKNMDAHIFDKGRPRLCTLWSEGKYLGGKLVLSTMLRYERLNADKYLNHEALFRHII